MTTDIPGAPPITPTIWVKLIGAAVRLFASIIGLINLASIAAHNGVEWHRLIHQAIENYREYFYPYIELVRPLLRWLHIDLSQTTKDVLSMFGAALAAANAESVVRDGRVLLWNASTSVFRTVIELARPDLAVEWERGLPPPSTLFRGLEFIAALPAGLFSALAFSMFIFGLEYRPDLFPALGLPMPSVPAWLSLWAQYGVLIGVFLCFPMIMLASAARSLPMILVGSALFLIAALPVFGVLVASSLATIVIGAAVATLLAPVFAWRTVAMTLVLFAALFTANLLMS